MIPNRIKRINMALKHELSNLMMREMKDPRLGFVSITDVVTSKDLRHARIYISVMDTEERKKETLACLNAASSFLRQRVRDSSRLRVTPDLAFFLDNSIERGVRLTHLIDEVRDQEKDI